MSDNDDAETVKDLILWARQRRILLSQVTVGAVTLAIAGEVGAPDKRPRSLEQATEDLYRKYGGQALADLETGGEENTTYEEDDEA